MKTTLSTILAFTVALLAMGTSQAQAAQAKKILIAYYSWGGNTREMAKQIKIATGGDLLDLVPVKPYPTVYRECTDQAKKEINAGFKPELKTKLPDLKAYDIVFVGSPCWWGTIAPPVATFLTKSDLAGKTIVPFMTHEGSGMGHSESDIKRCCPKSTVKDGLPIRGGSVRGAQEEVTKWVKGLGL